MRPGARHLAGSSVLPRTHVEVRSLITYTTFTEVMARTMILDDTLRAVVPVEPILSGHDALIVGVEDRVAVPIGRRYARHRIGLWRTWNARVDPDTGQCQRFASANLPAWARETPTITEVLPLLYLHGLSSGDFVPPLATCG